MFIVTQNISKNNEGRRKKKLGDLHLHKRQQLNRQRKKERKKDRKTEKVRKKEREEEKRREEHDQK